MPPFIIRFVIICQFSLLACTDQRLVSGSEEVTTADDTFSRPVDTPTEDGSRAAEDSLHPMDSVDAASAPKGCIELLEWCYEAVEALGQETCDTEPIESITVGYCMMGMTQCGLEWDMLSECLESITNNPCVPPLQHPSCVVFAYTPQCTDEPTCVDPACSPAFEWPSAAPTPLAITGSFESLEAIEASIASNDVKALTGHSFHDLTSGLIVDMNGDGLADILANRHMSVTKAHLLNEQQQVTAVVALPHFARLCVFSGDLDADGFDDLFCSYTGDGGDALDQHVIFWGGEEGLLEGETTLIDGPLFPGLAKTISAAIPWDVDMDGRLDLVISRFGVEPGYKAENVFYRNMGERFFSDATTDWGLNESGNTWATAFVDFDSDGFQDIYVMNDGTGAAARNRVYRFSGFDSDAEPTYAEHLPTTPVCDGRGLFGKELNPMGAALGDINADGRHELYIALTLLDIVLSEQTDQRWLGVRQQLGLSEPLTTEGQNQVRWSPMFWDLNYDGQPEILVPGGDNEGHANQAKRGESTITVYHLVANAKHERVAASIGLNETGHYGPMARGDVNHDGHLDLIVGGFKQHPRIYQNNLEHPHAHTLLRLSGTLSNNHGLGARIRVQRPSGSRVHQMGDRFGLQTQGEPLLDLALPETDPVQALIIEWPSGYTQHIDGPLAVGSLSISEPPIVTIDPPSRTLQAGSKKLVTIRASALDKHGKVLPNALVTIDTPWHDSVWVGEGSFVEPGVFERQLLAPSKPGRVRVEITLNGVPWRIRPWLMFRL
jgi:hypothetical protein